MRLLLILAFGLLTASSYAQCTITGGATLRANETATYTTDSRAACEDCYIWKSSSENLLIEGDSKLGKINVRAIVPGKYTLSVSTSDAKSTTCEKIIEVTEAAQTPGKNKCGVTIDDFKDVKVSESVVSFFPNENSADYEYNWTATYANNEVKTSTDKIPKFFFSDINYIKLVKLKITRKAAMCAVTISKAYDENYWKPATNSGKVQQRVYAPTSYSDYVKQGESTKSNDAKQ